MNGKRYLVTVSKLVLTLGILSVLASPASGQGSRGVLASTPDLVTEYIIDASPFTGYATKQVTVDAGATGAAVATCPDTAIVVGGGYAADPDVTFFTQYKYGNGWRGDARNDSASSETITVYAVCLNNVSGVSVTQLHGQVTISPGGKGQALATARRAVSPLEVGSTPIPMAACGSTIAVRLTVGKGGNRGPKT